MATVKTKKTLSKRNTVARRYEQDWAIAAATAQHLCRKIDSIGDIDSRDITKSDLFELRSCISMMDRAIETLGDIEQSAM